MQNIPLGPGHGFNSHAPLPTSTNSMCVDLHRARGIMEGERKALTTGTRKLETAPWLLAPSCLSSSPVAPLLGAQRFTPGHLPGALAWPASRPPTAGTHIPPGTHHHPTGKPKPWHISETIRGGVGDVCQLFRLGGREDRGFVC